MSTQQEHTPIPAGLSRELPHDVPGDTCRIGRKGLKEPFCSLSHFAGIVFTILALPLLMYLAGNRPWHIVGFTLYGAGLLAVYTASTLYHSLHVGPRAHDLLLRFDY